MPVVQRRMGEEAGEELRSRHLLLLPDDVDPMDVEALVYTRYPDAAPTPDGGLRIGRHTGLTGPLVLDRAAARAARVPEKWSLVYSVTCPTERGDPPWPGTTDPDGLYRAFPDGLPMRAEGRAVDLLVAVARRLGGAVRVHTSGVVLRPDPEVAVDVVVHAPYWLDPEVLHQALTISHPEARLAIEGEPWLGPPSGLVDSPPDEAAAELTLEQRIALHARADRLDAEAMAGEVVLDAYAVVLDVSRDRDEGLVEVLVHVAEEPPAAIAGLEWALRAVTYEVRWSPPDEVEARLEAPSGAFVAMRRRAHALVLQVARVVVEAADGVPVDADGFLLDRYSL